MIFPLAHQLQVIIRRPAHLGKAQTPLDALQVLPGALIGHDMSLIIALVQFLSGGPFVDTNHGDTDGPCSGMSSLIMSLHGGKEGTHAFPILNRRYPSLAST
jgi:hypothetical protein